MSVDWVLQKRSGQGEKGIGRMEVWGVGGRYGEGEREGGGGWQIFFPHHSVPKAFKLWHVKGGIFFIALAEEDPPEPGDRPAETEGAAVRPHHPALRCDGAG